jgi:hypothetical protein
MMLAPSPPPPSLGPRRARPWGWRRCPRPRTPTSCASARSVASTTTTPPSPATPTAPRTVPHLLAPRIAHRIKRVIGARSAGLDYRPGPFTPRRCGSPRRGQRGRGLARGPRRRRPRAPAAGPRRCGTRGGGGRGGGGVKEGRATANRLYRCGWGLRGRVTGGASRPRPRPPFPSPSPSPLTPHSPHPVNPPPGRSHRRRRQRGLLPRHPHRRHGAALTAAAAAARRRRAAAGQPPRRRARGLRHDQLRCPAPPRSPGPRPAAHWPRPLYFVNCGAARSNFVCARILAQKCNCGARSPPRGPPPHSAAAPPLAGTAVAAWPPSDRGDRAPVIR